MAAKGCISQLLEADQQAVLNMDDAQALRYVQEELGTITQKTREVQLTALTTQRLVDYIDSFPKAKQAEALTNILSTGSRSVAGRVSLEKHMEAVLGLYHSKMSKLLEQYKPKKLGIQRDIKGMDDIVREIYTPGSVKDPDAAMYAKLIGDVFEEMRQHFNRVGGDIPELKGWRLPQKHDPRKVGKVSFEKWMADIEPELDLPATWKAMDVGSEAEFLDFMRATYDSLATDGLSRLEPGKIPRKAVAKISNKHKDHRYLHFKDGDSWLKYQKQYGSPDTFTTITDHMEVMSREIAAMEVLGPNPEATFNFLRDTVAVNKGNLKGTRFAQHVYDNVMGRTYADDHNLADAIRGARNLGTATKLTYAPISAISDTAFQGLTAVFNDVPIMKQYARFFKTLTVGNKEAREFAARMGFVAEYAIDRASTVNRFSEIKGSGFLARWADVTMRANGLNRWTNSGRQAFQIEFLGAVTANVDKAFDDLSDGLKKAYARYGIDAADWGKLRKAATADFQGAKYIDPTQLSPDLNRKLVGMILTETDFAVPTANARVRAVLNQGTRAGTVSGELMRSVGQFKTFPVSVLMMHVGRGIGDQTKGDRLAYLAAMMFSTTAMGAIAYQAKEILKGREAMDMSNPKFWQAAFLQGGGLGIIGDFLFAEVNRYGGSFTATLAGPLAGDFEELVVKFALGTAQDVARMEEDLLDKVGAMTGRIVQKYSPGQLFYTKLLFDRYIFDQFNKQLDPNWQAKQRRAARRRQKDYDSSYWWKPGEFKP